MADDASWPLQEAIFAVLNGTVSAPVLDHVPQGTAKPYVQIGEGDSVDAGDKSRDGQSHEVILHFWSEYKGSKEIKELMREVYGLLHDQDLAVAGHDVLRILNTFATVLNDPDGKTLHGIQRYQVDTEVA